MDPKKTHDSHKFSLMNCLRTVAAALIGLPRFVADAAAGTCDSLIVLLPRLMRASVLLIAAAGALALAYLALRAIWWIVCWAENWLAG